MRFENKVVVITGGAHGIGKATKEALVATMGTSLRSYIAYL